MEIFSVYGVIKNVEMPPDPRAPHLNRGIAWVEFGDAKEAEDAMKHMDGGQIDGQEITAAPVLDIAFNRRCPPVRRMSPPRRMPMRRRSPPRYSSSELRQQMNIQFCLFFFSDSAGEARREDLDLDLRLGGGLPLSGAAHLNPGRGRRGKRRGLALLLLSADVAHPGLRHRRQAVE